MINKPRAACITSMAASLLALAACCMYLNWENRRGNQGPDMMRGLDYLAMVALIVAYVVVFLCPSVFVVKYHKTTGLWIMTSVNGFAALITAIGFLSLFF